MADSFSQDMNTIRQWRIIGIIFAVFVAILAIAYFLFLRLNYSLLYQNLPVSDASSIVAELEAKEIKYRLRNGGQDILVPAVDADAIRLGIIDSEAPRKKLDGFELFNDSEMGLTDFAQKIKYQRALQGELARTIMMIDGVEDARVHIAMPERVLFRGNTSRPTAAVTIVSRSGQFDEEARISGIQRLVAASVPDLDVEEVSVLNSAGEIISAVETPITSILNEYAQISAAYKEQIEIALALEMPELTYDLKLLARPLRVIEDPAVKPDSDAAEGVATAKRDHTLKVLFVTDQTLSEPVERRVESLIVEAAQLNVELGDFITFRQRELPLNLSLANAAQNSVAPVSKQVMGLPSNDFSFQDITLGQGMIGSGTLLLLGFTGVALVRRRRQILSAGEHVEFAQRLKLQLQDAEEVNDAVL